MGFSSLQVYMDSSDWLQGTIHNDSGMDSSSPSGEMLACSRPLIERRLRPPHDQALKCPRCDSTHTKFCYYNNYSLSQPRYFCKTCRRYWTKGGTLRNIPVGGGCRKNKKVSAKKSNDQSVTSNPPHLGQSSHHMNHSHTDLQRYSFAPDVQLSHLSHLLGTHAVLGEPSFMETKYSADMFENPKSLDFNYRSYDFMGNNRELVGVVGGFGDVNGQNGLAQSFHGLCSPPFGMAMDGNINSGTGTGTNYAMDSCQRLMLPYDANEDPIAAMDVKPNPKLLSLDWQDQGFSDHASKDSFGYVNGVGSWTGMMSGYGSSSTNPLV